MLKKDVISSGKYDRVDDEPEVLQPITEDWIYFNSDWQNVHKKYFTVTVPCGRPSNKRILYINTLKEVISLRI